jgi:hypothetical protein
MSLFSRLLRAVDSWRLRRGGPKTAKRAGTAVEQLDHRRLLSVNFTGNVPVDFPATESPGVAIISNNVNFAPIGANLQPYVSTSGFNIQDIRVTYTPSDDSLSIGLDGPPAGPSTTSQVIAGDADDNGNSGTVNPAVLAVDPNFMDNSDFGGSEYMGVSLDFTGSGTPQIVAGYPAITPVGASVKTYEVALAGNAPGNFGTSLPQFTGNVYTVNSPSNPNLEFSITHFSELYQEETGQALTAGSTIYVGGYGGSGSDGNIGEASIGPGPFTLGSATPVTPPVNPEPSPPILINPHEHRIIDTGHRDLIRVSIFGTSGFPVSEINPATVKLDGASSIAHITRKVRRDEFPFQTYVFVADQLNGGAGLPPGLTTATLTGQTNSGVNFESQKDVLNLPHSALAFGRLKQYMGNASYLKRLAKLEARNPGIANTSTAATVSLGSRNAKATGAAAIKVDYTPKVSAAGNTAKADSVKIRPVVSLKRADAAGTESNVPTRVRYSMEHHLGSAR